MPDVALRHRQGAFSLEVEFSFAQPWTVVFGPSGAGKSTILRILSGLMLPDSGRIALDGRIVLDTAKKIVLPPGRRSIGFVTQQAALFPHLTVEENVAFGIRPLDRHARAARVAEMLSSFGARALAQRMPAQLSGGERQRVALARALAPRPRLLLLDEPLAALDDASAQDILARLLSLDLRVVYVSHDLAEIWRLPANVILLEAGRIVATGPLREVLAAHRDRLLQLLGS
ncbi:MAG TPA: ATP-binding cassette domain-containing protein [Acidobacteriaceae bacterium]|nr:ATP-binding cassette domain-containing protein [Acidobacteriaceae bacterium]